MIVIPVNGRNERMGALFKTPKHLLLVDGEPAILRTVDYMSQFGEVTVIANERYYDDLTEILSCKIVKVEDTSNVVETLRLIDLQDDLWIVDCDIVPENLNSQNGNTVYLFPNTERLNNYSHFLLDADSNVISCNEKILPHQWAGAGVYYFQKARTFYEFSRGSQSVAWVINRAVSYHNEHPESPHGFLGDTTSQINRIGTLPDITGGFTGNQIRILKTGDTVQGELEWYAAYEDKGDLPKVQESSEHNSFLLEFLSCTEKLDVEKVYAMIQKYRYYKPMNFLTFSEYRGRICSHLLANPLYNEEKLEKELSYTVLSPSFCHGDLSSRNIIPTNSGHKLIDPLYSTTRFGCWQLDCAKFLFSLKFYDNDIKNYNKFREMVNISRLDTLIAAECVRVATYNKRFNFIAENLINEL